jgi:hypothetical protein
MSETKPSMPTETDGTEVTRFNALRHGVLSRYTVLPWEDADEYRALLEALVAEHAPQGPTQEHLVEELAGIVWRKRRLRLAELAAHRRGLGDTLPLWRQTAKAALVPIDADEQSGWVVDAIRATAADTEQAIRAMQEHEAVTHRAIKLLGSKRDDAYEAALAALRKDMQACWANELARSPAKLKEGEEPATANVESLLRFLEGKVQPWYDDQNKELANRKVIREQAFGEALDPDRLERLGRYEVHLDRKFERVLAMLLRLKDLREETVAG